MCFCKSLFWFVAWVEPRNTRIDDESVASLDAKSIRNAFDLTEHRNQIYYTTKEHHFRDRN